MFENLNQPYIFNNNFKHSVKTILLVSMAYMLIMLYFQPFGINFLNSNDGYFVLGTGILAALTFFVNTQVLPGIFPKTFNSEGWTVKKEIILNLCMFIFLSFSFGVLAYLFNLPFLTYSIPVFFPAALAVLPIMLFNFINYNNSLKLKMVKVFDSGKHWLAEEKKLFESEKLGTTPQTIDKEESKVNFISENGKEISSFEPDKLLLLKSCGNYVEVFYMENSKLKKKLLRQTISNLETVLAEYTQFLRSHRCCLVNANHIKKMTSASGNYLLEVNGLDFNVPVSRSKIAEIRNIVLDKAI
ncbi:MAG: LytTR family DNA-binding domain-containing protein [Omnitrophica WOR_2 bacterium]